MFTLAAACGLLLLRAVPAVGGDSITELEDALNSNDEVHLLQEKVLERRRGGGTVGAGLSAERKASAPSVCENPPAEAPDDDGPGPAGASPPVPAADAAEAGPPSFVVAPRRADSEGISSDTVEACSWALRRAMSALTALLLLVGIVRWRALSCSAAGPEENEGAPQGAGDVFQQLMRAAIDGDEARARQLLARGAPVGEADIWGCTALHAAAKGGLRGLAGELLDRGAELGAADAWDDTPLHTACRAGQAEVCELLVSRGAEVDAVNAQGWAPLVVAGHAGHRDVCLLLLDGGAGAPGLPEEGLPQLLRELGEKGTPTTVAPEEEDQPSEWPTEEDWEEHMRESVDNFLGPL